MKRFVALLVLVVAWPLPAFPWGQEGHSIVAEIAQRHLSPAALAKVQEILGSGESLASVASWADDVRDDRPETYNWHFVDIPLASKDYTPSRDCKPTAKGDCAIAEIARAQQTLGDPAADAVQRREALMFLVHFVGDLHQPLHTVLEGAGENTLKVSFFTDPTHKHTELTNLHVVWDGGLIRSVVWDWGAYVTLLQEHWLPGKDLEALGAGTPTVWVLEAHREAQNAIDGIETGQALGEDYLEAMRPILDQELALAGVRLARILNETLK